MNEDEKNIRKGLLLIALQSKTHDLLSVSKDSDDYLEKLKDRDRQVNAIREQSPVVEFPEKGGKHLDVRGSLSWRGFWVDFEKNKTYFQLSTCPCSKCDNEIVIFSPKNSFVYVLAPICLSSSSYEVYAEIDGIVELENKEISDFLGKSVELKY